jgi:hypothetical protein
MLQVHGKVCQLEGSPKARTGTELVDRCPHTPKRFLALGEMRVSHRLQLWAHVRRVVQALPLQTYPAVVGVAEGLQPLLKGRCIGIGQCLGRERIQFTAFVPKLGKEGVTIRIDAFHYC